MNRYRAYTVRNVLIFVLLVLLLASIALLLTTGVAAENAPQDCPVGNVCLQPGEAVYVYCQDNSLVDPEVVDDRTVIVFCNQVELIPVWRK